MQERSGIHSPIYGDVADLESFQACIEEVKKEAAASTEDPNLHEVLGEIVSSQHPIVEGDIFRVFRASALRVLQAKKTRANFTEEETHQLSY